MNEDTQIKKAIERAEDLLKQRRQVLSLPPEKALDRILDSPQPAALVHSFPEEDFYFLIHDIGPEDSLPLLSLASDRQWEYIFDIEAWKRDRIEIISVTKWLDLLLNADSNRFIRWLLDHKTEFIEFYLFENIEVIIREHDQDPSDFGEGFFTIDDTFYIRFTDHSFAPEPDKAIKERRNAFLTKLIEHLAAYDHVMYQHLLLEALSIIPAESEEEAYRLRNVRLAEKGFLPFEEAIGIYQPLSPQELEKQSTKSIARSLEKTFLPVPLYHVEMLKEDNLFTNSLKEIETDEILRQIQTEFAGLSNQIIAADQKIIREKEKLRSVLRKACGYLSIGLERLTKENRKPGVARAAELIEKYPLSQIFRIGYGLALELKWQAERWHTKCWFAKQRLPLSFWGEEWLGVLGGLLIKKPLFFDNYKTGVLYREFDSIDDIKETERVLNEIIAFDDLLSLMAIEVKPLSDSLLTHKNFLLTLWARNYLGLSEELSPLALNELKRFFDDLFTGFPDPGKDRPRKTNISMKESFLNWLSDKAGLDPYEISKKLGQALENLFSEIESEYGKVSTKDLDPRYVYLFLLAKQF